MAERDGLRASSWLSRRRLLGGAVLLGLVGTLAESGSAEARAYQDQERERGLGSLEGPSGGSFPHSTRVLWDSNTAQRLVALTFDDGPMERFTRPLLEVLDRAKVPATFCVVGARVQQQQSLVRRELSGRHELVNHTWSHPDLSALGAAGVDRELERTNEVIARLTGRRPALLRPPYGRLSGVALRAAARSGHDVLMWDVKLHEQSQDIAGNVHQVLRQLTPGTVLLGPRSRPELPPCRRRGHTRHHRRRQSPRLPVRHRIADVRRRPVEHPPGSLAAPEHNQQIQLRASGCTSHLSSAAPTTRPA